MTQGHSTDDTTAVERTQNLPFEIVAEAQNNIINQQPKENIPLNYKIRIKSKKEPKMKQAIISVPKLNMSQRNKNIRLVSSDQTIMSFDLYVDPHSDKIIPKKRDSFFLNIFKPGCLMQNDVDDVPYMPSASHNANNMQKIPNDKMISDLKLDVTEKFALRKNFVPPANTDNSQKTILGQCKKGGCLDPPFSEDNYAYKPTSISPDTKSINNDDFDNSTKNIPTKSSEDLLLDCEIKKKIRDSVISHSLITYSETISISKTKNYEESQNASIEQTSINTRLMDNEFTELYYIPPKHIKKKLEENKNKQYIDPKVMLETKEITPVDTSLLHSGEIKMTEPELIAEDIFKDDKTDIQRKVESSNKKSTNMKNELYTPVEYIDPKVTIESKEITPVDVSLLDSGEKRITEPEHIAEDLLKDDKSDIKEIFESSNTNMKNELYIPVESIDPKLTLETKEITPVDASLLDSGKKTITEPEHIAEDLLKDDKSDIQKKIEIKNKKITNMNNELYTTGEYKDNVKEKNKDAVVIDNEDNTFVSENEKREPILINMKEPLDESRNKYNIEKGNTSEVLQNDIATNSTKDLINTSKDLLTRNLKFKSENDIATINSLDINKERTVVHTTQSNININQFSSFVDLFDNRLASQTKLNENKIDIDTLDIETATSGPKIEYLENSKEVSMNPKQDEIIDTNVVYNRLETSRSSKSSIQKHISEGSESENKGLEYSGNINKIQQSPKQPLQDLNNTTINNDVNVAEKLSMKINGTQNSEIMSTASIIHSENFIEDQSTLFDNTQKYDQNINKKDTNGQEIEQDLYSRRSNESKELITDNQTEIDNTGRQNVLSELNISKKSFDSRSSEKDHLKTNNFISGQNDQDEIYNIKKLSTISPSNLSKHTPTLKSNSSKSSKSEKSRSEDLIKSDKLLNEPKLEREKYYDAPDVISNEQINTSETQHKDFNATNSENGDISSSRVKQKDSNNLSQAYILGETADLMSNESENIELRNSTRNESYTNNNFEIHQTTSESIRTTTLDKHSSANSDPNIKKSISPSSRSIDLSKKLLQKSTDATHRSELINKLESNIIYVQNDKTQPEYLDSSQTIKMFESAKKNIDDFININESDNILLGTNDINNIEHKKNSSNPFNVALNLNFHISNNDENSNVFIRTFDPILPPNRYLDDKFVSIKCVVTENDEEIKIPLNSNIDFTLNVKKKTSSKDVLNQTRGIHKTFSEGSIKSSSILHDTLNSVYNNLLPLKDIINNLRQEIKSMSQQQMQFLKLLDKMETKPLRLIDIDKTCKCQKQALADMCAYYG